jgi:hypothetical protein
VTILETAPLLATPFTAGKRVQQVVDSVLRYSIDTPDRVLAELKKISSDAKAAGVRLRHDKVESMFIDSMRRTRASRPDPCPVPTLIEQYWGAKLTS